MANIIWPACIEENVLLPISHQGISFSLRTKLLELIT